MKFKSIEIVLREINCNVHYDIKHRKLESILISVDKADGNSLPSNQFN